MKKTRLSAACLQILCLAAWTASSVRAEEPKSVFDQGGIADGAIEMVTSNSHRHRYKIMPRTPRVVPAHDYTVCNGPSCFSCTHETKCLEKTIKMCLRINPITLDCEYKVEKVWECNPGPGHICSPK